jgi:hypothetical protein
VTAPTFAATLTAPTDAGAGGAVESEGVQGTRSQRRQAAADESGAQQQPPAQQPEVTATPADGADATVPKTPADTTRDEQPAAGAATTGARTSGCAVECVWWRC